MNVIEPTIEGKVVAVCAAPKHRFSKTACLSINLVAGLGVEGDAHFGSFLRHRYLARRYPRAHNNRQVHLIPVELFDELHTAGYDVAPGDLGENIATAGIDLEMLPLDTELRIGSAVIRLTGLRTPCVLIDRFRAGLKTHLVSDGPGPPFRAGVMGVVTVDGGGARGSYPDRLARRTSARASCDLTALPADAATRPSRRPTSVSSFGRNDVSRHRLSCARREVE